MLKSVVVTCLMIAAPVAFAATEACKTVVYAKVETAVARKGADECFIHDDETVQVDKDTLTVNVYCDHIGDYQYTVKTIATDQGKSCKVRSLRSKMTNDE